MKQTELAARDYRILAAFAAGRTLQQIALAERVDPNTVRRTLRRYGVNPSPQLRPVEGAVIARLADREWLAAEYAVRDSTQIAEELGCTPRQVLSALIRGGIPRRHGFASMREVPDRKAWPVDLPERVVELYCRGASVKDVAQELGVSTDKVYRLLRKRGVLRSRGEAISLASRRRR